MDPLEKNLKWRKLSKNNSQKESNKASKGAKKHNHIFEQLSMYKGEQSNDSRKKKEMKLKKKLRKLRTIIF